MDLVHHYLIQHAPPEKQDEITRALTGDLGQYGSKVATPKLRPPPWSRIKLADIERMNQARRQAQGT